MTKEDILVLKDHIVKTIRKRNLLNKENKETKSKKINLKIEKIDEEIGRYSYLLSQEQNESIDTINRKLMIPKTARKYQIGEGTLRLLDMLGIKT